MLGESSSARATIAPTEIPNKAPTKPDRRIVWVSAHQLVLIEIDLSEPQFNLMPILE